MGNSIRTLLDAKRILKTLLAAFVLGTASAGVGAQGIGALADDYRKVTETGQVINVIDVDNDSLLLNKDDGFYTSGLRYTRLHMLESAAGATYYGWRIGQELYTASDIKLPPEEVGPPNHPYAGWLFAGMFKQVSSRNGAYTRFGLDVGCLGPCAGGKSTQTTFHKILNQPEPQGWSKQVRNEFGVILHGEFAPASWKLGSMVDITPDLHGRFGNIVTDAGVGLHVRAGRLNELPGKPTAHAFLKMYANAVGYNATLQGGYFSSNNPHTVDPKRGVGAAEAGFAWSSGAYGFRLSLVRHSNEIDALPQSIGAQNFVRVQFSWTP